MVYVCAMTQNTLVVSFRWVHHVNGADMLDSGIFDMSQNICLLSDLRQKLGPFFFCLELLLLLFCLCGCREGATRQNLTNYAHVITENGRGNHAYIIIKIWGWLLTYVMKMGVLITPTQYHAHVLPAHARLFSREAKSALSSLIRIMAVRRL